MTRLRTSLLTAAGAVAAALAVAPSGASAQAPVDCVTRAGAYEPGVNCRTVAVDGAPREFIVYVPERAAPSAAGRPLVFMFHGTSGDGAQYLRISGWREQADATGLVAVFPTGLRYRILESGRRVTKWNDGGLAAKIDLGERPPSYPAGAPMPADDVGFVDTMLADLRARLPIDPARTYASGFSNGGEFTARLAMERSGVFAAAGFSAGGLDRVHVPDRPIPLALTLGTRDDRVLAQTGLPELPLDPAQILATPAIAATLGTLQRSLGLLREPTDVRTQALSTRLRWSGAGGRELQFTMLAGVTHQFPNGGNNPAGFEAAAHFARFFAAHPLPVR